MLHRCARLGGILLVAGAVIAPVSAAPNAQDFDQRLSALERAAGSAGAGQSQAQLVIQLQQMQAEIRQLRGMVEESANQVEQLQKRQREFYLDLDSRLSALEPGGGTPRDGAPPAADGANEQAPPAAPAELSAAEPAVPPVEAAGPVERPVAPVVPASPPPPAAEQVPPVAAVPPSAPPAPDVSGGEQAAYRAASDLLRMGRYEDAIAGFQGQLKTYPGGALADNAQYWIGEAYYVTRQFDRALAEFQRVPSEYPQSPKAADALLKVGYIQYERRDFSAARQTLTNLKATWPNSPAARLADNRLARMKEEGV